VRRIDDSAQITCRAAHYRLVREWPLILSFWIYACRHRRELCHFQLTFVSLLLSVSFWIRVLLLQWKRCIGPPLCAPCRYCPAQFFFGTFIPTGFQAVNVTLIFGDMFLVHGSEPVKGLSVFFFSSLRTTAVGSVVVPNPQLHFSITLIVVCRIP
jgi:hypothetical protein